MAMRTDQVIQVTILHGVLLSGALLLRAALAPPLNPYERGVARAYQLAARGAHASACAVAGGARERARQRLGAEAPETTMLTRVLAELCRQAGDLQRARLLYEELLAGGHRGEAQVPPGVRSWLAEGGRTRLRRRSALVADTRDVELPGVQEGYERVLAELRARGA